MVGFARQMLSGQSARHCVRTVGFVKHSSRLHLHPGSFYALHRSQERRCAASASGTSAQGPGSSATASSAHMEHKHTNRLAQEQSPYLLQHAHNPVNWYPWGDEAIQAARDQDKPIFLSVGYATCHWCHVMEHESFESEETAAVMNKHFINIKVDREERPDVDRVYMTFIQATTGGGGWPMSVWLTPDLKPFYGGTYYPGKDQYGMPSFMTVLKRIAQLWDTKRADLQEQGNTVMEQLQEFTAPDSPAAGAAASLTPQQLAHAVNSCAATLAKGFDRKLGGFGPAPKFPRPSEINLLLRAATAQGSPAASTTAGKKGAAAPSPSLLLGMSLFSLQAMAAGGMYDQLGGGFHRYSVDEFWHVPHFEKMLYDNPQLALTYLDAFRITLAKQRSSSSSSSRPTQSLPDATAVADAGVALASPIAAAAAATEGGAAGSGVSTSDEVLYDPRVYATVVRGILDYLRRDMTHPEGGLYSAEDADSLDTETNKKSEGSFYVWAYDEIQQVLGEERAGVFCEVYGVKPGGNCTLSARSDPHKEFGGKNVLAEFMRVSEASSVSSAGLPLTRAQELLGKCRQELVDRRVTRPRPALDDKIVTAWNGQGISAFALASRVLPAEQPPAGPCFPVDGCSPQTYMQAAVAVAEFVKRQLWEPSSKRLKRAFCKAPSAVEGFADDYALLIAGLLDLYEAGGGLQWLQWAVELQDTLDSTFWDPTGGYFQTSGGDASVLLRLKEDYDGAEPAASSVAATNLIRLAALMPEGGSPSGSSNGGSSSSSMSYSDRAGAVIKAFSSRLQQASIAMPQMCAAAWLKSKTPLRQVIVSGETSQTDALLDAAHAAWAPDKALILIDPANPDSVAFWKAQNPEAWAMVDAHYSKQQKQAAGTGSSSAGSAIVAEPAGAAESTVADMGLQPTGGSAAAGAAGDGSKFPPTAFVCQNFTCQAPTGDPGKVYDLLMQQSAGVVKLQPVKL